MLKKTDSHSGPGSVSSELDDDDDDDDDDIAEYIHETRLTNI